VEPTLELTLDSLAVIGLGAVGGSLARQARAAGVPRVVGRSSARAVRGAAPVVLASLSQGTLEFIGRPGPVLKPGAVLADACRAAER
jgi:prephenate dehydrogenase